MTKVNSANEISSVEKQVTTLNGKLKEDTPKILESFIRTTLEQMNRNFNDGLNTDEEYLKLKRAVTDYKRKVYEQSDLCRYAKYVAGRYVDYAAKVYKLRYGCKMAENQSSNEQLAKMVSDGVADTEARIISVVCQFNDTFEVNTRRAKVSDLQKISECRKAIEQIKALNLPKDIFNMSVAGVESKFGAEIYRQVIEK